MSFNKPAPLATAREMDKMERISINCCFIVSEEQNVDRFLFDQGKSFLVETKIKCPQSAVLDTVSYLLNLIIYVTSSFIGFH